MSIVRLIGLFIVAAALACQAPPNVALAPATPDYAQRYMRALCDMNTDYLSANTHPGYATADDIAESVARSGGFICSGVKYLGSYATEDTHVFAVVINDKETFYIFSFDADRLVIGVQ